MVKKAQIFSVDMVIALTFISITFIGFRLYSSVESEVLYESQHIQAEDAMETLAYKLRKYEKVNLSEFEED